MPEINDERALQKATSEPQSHIIADIVGHPQSAPTVKELGYMNPRLDEDTLREHLSALQSAGIVEELVLETEDRVRGYPYTFYRLTDHARDLFEKNGFFSKEPWQRQYARVEKPSDIREIQEIPRPEP